MSDHSHAHHISSPQSLIATFVALIGLTLLTCVMAQFPLGSWDMPVTLAIATVKALMVAVIFMHLQHDKLFNSLLIAGAAIFLVLFLGMVVLDSNQYQNDVQDYLDDKAPLTATP
ncbi:MAG: cytochrome C oxidase subunit IV family protein [Lacipirellulaceae bacterium]